LSNNNHSSTPIQFSRVPANFTFPAILNIQIDTSGNVIPLHINSLHAEVYDLNTDVQVGEGDIAKGGMTIGAKEYKDVGVPVVFSYVATNDSDQTCECFVLFWFFSKVFERLDTVVFWFNGGIVLIWI
jgi:hypothetical protein